MNALTVTTKRAARRDTASLGGSRTETARSSAPPGQTRNASLGMDAPEPTASPGTRPQRLVSKPWGVTAQLLRAVTVLGLCAYAAHSLIGLGGHSLDRFFEDWVFNGLLLASSALCLLRAACSKVDRGAWSALGAGLGCWALGEVLFTLDPAQVST